ncbi:Glycosyltransferase involved in cell wall bisynthesis [Singulisphaera sp. GP187]|uniref:glycosyltransferase n=1 Tax=Singulisphaera sp. GP187 TaxID=1882752 RepID=UPI00092A5BF6|nr:glycosyltransferase [Singulisphaera sp. GP187]SIO61489.1 Glycosyltransferase involved in cell wall bisynthesis [Singulisphaera sp. GP187]
MNPVKPRVLVIATMFPNPALPNFGIFVARRLRAAAEFADLEILSPVPWFPFGTCLKRYRHREHIPVRSEMFGLKVHYPRFLSIPRYFKPFDGIFLAASIWWATRRSKFDLIDAQLAFPEGWAARLLAKLRRVPFCITVRGHDVNHLPAFPVRGQQVRYALSGASRVMSVAEALRQCVLSLGCPEDRTETIPNGVDLKTFRPVPREVACQFLKLDPDKHYLVSVGHLVERKGHHVLIEALALLKERHRPVPTLAIIGAASEEGDISQHLRELIAKHGLEAEVILVGEQSPDKLPFWYSAADALCLASSKEGWANVLLESLACGTPVIGTRVWGTPEVICNESLGILVTRDAKSFALAFEQLRERPFLKDELIRHASGYSWEQAGRKLAANYQLALGVVARG